MEIFGYFCGIFLHVLFKWSRWKQEQNGRKRPWMAYWNEYLAENITAGITAVASTFLWQMGVVHHILIAVAGAFAKMFGANVSPDVVGGFWVALAAGYLMDSAARNLWALFNKKAQGN